MRSLSLFALVLASLTLTVSAQDYKTPKAKPYHSDSKRSEGKNKGGVSTDKKVTPRGSSSQELRRVEQQTAKSSTSKRAAKHQGHAARVLKAEQEKRNPPIHFSSAEGTHGSSQGKNPYKGRVRQKGNGKH